MSTGGLFLVAFLAVFIAGLYVIRKSRVRLQVYNGLGRWWKIAGGALVLAHSALIAWVVYEILYSGEPDWPMYWLLIAAIDFPASLLIMPFAFLASLFPSDIGLFNDPYQQINSTHNFILPAIFFSIVGNAWWFYVPKLCHLFIGRLNQENEAVLDQNTKLGT
jgi:hypothetical protein